VLSLRVGLVPSIYPLVCASSLVILHFRPHVLRFLCPCVDRVISSPLHRFPSLQPVAFACVLLLPGSPLGMYSPHQQHSFVSYIDHGSADTFDPQHTNKPTPLVFLLETYLSSLLASLFFFFGCCYSYHCLSPVVQYFRLLSPFSLSIVLVLICFNSVTCVCLLICIIV